jgi:capsid protein
MKKPKQQIKKQANIKADYDILKPNKQRRTPKREMTGEAAIYDPSKRALGANIGRDLERNYAPARGIIHQFRMNVAGSLGKLQVNIKDSNGVSIGEEAAQWFNGVWAKDCDFRDQLHWSVICQNVVAAMIREGDLLAVFDDDLIEDSGKLLTWESDQVVPMTDAVMAAKGPKGGTQDNGIIRDKWGRVTHYSVTGKRGLSVIDKPEDVTIFPRDVACLPRNPFRLNQGRGVPCIITAASSLLDVYEMLMRELQSAKKAATQYAMVTRDDAVVDFDNPAAVDIGSTPSTGSGGNTPTNLATGNLESLEAFTGGYTDYGQTGDKIQFPPVDRPNVNMIGFIESVQCQAGAAFGLARAYTLLRADSSYTSFRGDMILSWAGAFYPMQKLLERCFADWVAERALKWAQRKGIIKTLPAGWEQKLSWTWPVMPEVDELDAQNAIAASLKNGTTDFSKLLGPDWRQRLESLAEQLKVITDLGIPLSILEMKSGGVADNPKKDTAQPATKEAAK